jgi:hypothetical protein
MRHAEEILEIAEILDQTADRLAKVLERSGADKLQPAETLREMAEDAGDEKTPMPWQRCSVPTPPSSRHWSMPTSRLLSRNRAKRARPAPSPWGENPEAEPSPSLSADALRVPRQILM